MLFKLFVSFYGIAKEVFEFEILQNYAAKNVLLKRTLQFLTVVLTLLLLSTYIIVVPFIILRCFVHIYLKIKHGSDFGSFLTAYGTLFEGYEEKSTIVTIATVDESNVNSFHEKLEVITKKIYDCNYIFSSLVKDCFGYKYYLKNQVKPEEVLRKISLNPKGGVLTKDDVLTFLEEYKIKGGKLWEIGVFEELTAEKRLMFFVRFNHCVTDAYFMIALFKKYVLDPEISDVKDVKFEKPNKKFSLDDIYLNTNPLSRNVNELFQGSEEQFITNYLEDKQEYVQKIKRIKDFLGVAFSDILLAGLIKTVTDLMKKKIGRCGENVTFHLTTRGRSDDLEKILNGTFDTDELKNEFAFIFFTIPTPKQNTTAIEYLKNVNSACKRAKSSIDTLLLYIVPQAVCPFMPMFLNRLGFPLVTRNVCLISTNMSAVDKGTIADKEITNVFAYTSMYTNQGLMLSTVTYDGKLQLCLVGRLKFLNERDDLNEVMSNMIDYVDQLDNEINNNTVKK